MTEMVSGAHGKRRRADAPWESAATPASTPPSTRRHVTPRLHNHRTTPPTPTARHDKTPLLRPAQGPERLPPCCRRSATMAASPAHAAMPPPSRSASRKRAGDDSVGNPSQKRSRAETAFSTATKEQIKREYSTVCTHCGAFTVDTAHVFAQADDNFDDCKALHRISLESHRDIRNAVVLCVPCHIAYDRVWYALHHRVAVQSHC